jgi:DNA-binding CsgD family transcriptional regulator
VASLRSERSSRPYWSTPARFSDGCGDDWSFVVSLKVVPALTRPDAKRLLRFVGEAESLDGDDPFTSELLAELGRLVPAERVLYGELDRVRQRCVLDVRWPNGERRKVEREDDVWRFLEEHPLCLARREGHSGAIKLSDFLTQRELHRTWAYDFGFAPYEIEYQLEVSIPSPPWRTTTFLFNRSGAGRDFTERDRLVLDLLQPHLARLWHGARTRRLLRAALSSLGHASERDSRGVILLVDGDIEFASAPARRLLSEFFPGVSGDRLPIAVEKWLEFGATSPLIGRRGARQLSVDRVDDALLLEERHAEVQLTVREREVLAWVARGKTNAEIARVLWVAPNTVRKHLENVYAKLGVNTRTAAVARFLGLIDAEAS